MKKVIAPILCSLILFSVACSNTSAQKVLTEVTEIVLPGEPEVMPKTALVTPRAVTNNGKTKVDEQVACPAHLFTISKSDNTNILYYDVNMKDGLINSQQPLDIYWLLHAKQGQKDTMTRAERPQFDVTFKELEKNKSFEIKIRNKQLNYMILALNILPNGCASLTTTINKIPATLDNVHITLAKGGFLIPSVLHLDINGTDKNGNKVTERVINK